MRTQFLILVVSFILSAFAATIEPINTGSLNAEQPRSLITLPCENTPISRECWGEYSIDTNWYEVTPNTGVTREYWFSIENSTVAPDGYEVLALTVNGSIPGPTVVADWGDEVVVHVTNNMENNGTAIHWHGIRQLENSEHDGVPGVTQCPIAPGESYTYRWQATQYGTTWYHAHFSLQYSLGIQGPIVINGPATANYDEDLGTIILQDWSHISPFSMWWYDRLPSGPPSLSNGLINGRNVFYCTNPLDPSCLGNGTRFETHFEKGKKYRIRIVNTGLYSNFRFSIDHHQLTVIANDLVPLVPYTTDNVIISMGQRYDLVVEANAAVDNYWLRAIFQTTCCPNDYANNTLGIVRYDPSSTEDPTTSNPATEYPDACMDEPASDLVPYLGINVGQPASITTFYLSDVTLALPQGFLWTLNDSYLWVNWSSPTIARIMENDNIWPTDYNVIPLTGRNQWAYLVFNDISNRNRSHPMHLHGHDFYVLAQGPGNYSSNTRLNLNNPPRRDTATWPESGYLVIAFKMDNPGSWLIHCHIAWHSSESLGLQLVESESQIVSTMKDYNATRDICKSWNTFWNKGENYLQEDSGI